MKYRTIRSAPDVAEGVSTACRRESELIKSHLTLSKPRFGGIIERLLQKTAFNYQTLCIRVSIPVKPRHLSPESSKLLDFAPEKKEHH